MVTQFHPANVDQDQLKTLQSLEQNLGRIVVAMEPETSQYATLTDDELAGLQAVEKKLGMVIVAFDN